jgi:hypothetical protein
MIIEDERNMTKNFQYISNGDLIEPEHDANWILKGLNRDSLRCIIWSTFKTTSPPDQNPLKVGCLKTSSLMLLVTQLIVEVGMQMA